MFRSTLIVMQFIDEAGQRSQPFVVNPNKFAERVQGFNDEMLEETLVLVLADCKADDSGGFIMSGISSFPVVSARFFRDLSLSDVVHREFSDHENMTAFNDESGRRVGGQAINGV